MLELQGRPATSGMGRDWGQPLAPAAASCRGGSAALKPPTAYKQQKSSKHLMVTAIALSDFCQRLMNFNFFLSRAVLGMREVQKMGSGRGLRSSFGLIPFQYRVAVSLSSQMLPSLLSMPCLEFVGFLFFPKEKRQD